MDVLEEVYSFYDFFDGEKGIIGYSLEGRPIHYFCLTKQDYPVMVATYSIHAREYITTYLALESIKKFRSGGKIGKVYFIPTVNPDGVYIATHGKPLYKANARGVDLNTNFDAHWGKGDKNVFFPNDENYVGKYPFSEPETIALKNFTLKVKPNVTLSFHSKGEEIYWEFFQNGKDKERDYFIAKAAEKSTGYALKSVKGSVGGYKDWCIEKLKIPSLTIEVGSDRLKHPIKERSIKKIVAKTGGLIESVMLALKETDKWI